ncbi:hypothetical protein [Ammoniphilus sp. 3BR4]|uniref:hypothetical protein n=1 Tax=Ammoniphilus sp. 3BR4 TaxID=3158265 RepID=UPI00346632F6
MNPTKLFRKGTVIKIINEDHPFFGKVAFVDSLKSDELYHIKLTDGREILLFADEIEPWKSNVQGNQLRMG